MPSDALFSPTTSDAGEAVADPIPPPRTPLAIAGPVGRGAANNAPDVRAVQDRLVELRTVDAATIAPERPSAAGAVPEASLAQTIAAIESFQRQVAIDVNGTVGLADGTRAELDRAIPLPAPDELSAIAAALQTINQTIGRGLTITGPVGAVATGNAVDDVRAVQARLVAVGRLSPAHGERPATGATGSVPYARLATTIAALGRFQDEVRFFVDKRTIAGAVTPGVVSPGDATAALLDRISVYTMAAGGSRVTFRDHVVSATTQSEMGVAFSGSAPPSALPLAAYTSAGLDPAQAAALKLVSTFESHFDAVNTYDRALVSAGFIQFAGGRGLPPYIALLKARQAARFRDLLQTFGLDVEFSVTAGAIAGARLIVIDPAGTRVLRGTAAETAIRDNKRLTTALILSGRDRDVQLVQLEAAVRGYVVPALAATIVPSSHGGSVRLREILRSKKGLAALFDRAIQEGVAGARRRFERVIQRMIRAGEPHPPAPPPKPPTELQLQGREGDVLAELERDLQAAGDVAGHLTRARQSLQTLIQAAAAAGASVGGLIGRPELTAARQAVTAARAALPDVVNIVTGGNVDTQLAAIAGTLAAEQTRLALTPAPGTVADLSNALAASRQALEQIAGPFATAPIFLDRIRRIRRSTLDSGLAASA
jgi:hypothetical protein